MRELGQGSMHVLHACMGPPTSTAMCERSMHFWSNFILCSYFYLKVDQGVKCPFCRGYVEHYKPLDRWVKQNAGVHTYPCCAYRQGHLSAELLRFAGPMH